jgi:hypothetical protein
MSTDMVERAEGAVEVAGPPDPAATGMAEGGTSAEPAAENIAAAPEPSDDLTAIEPPRETDLRELAVVDAFRKWPEMGSRRDRSSPASRAKALAEATRDAPEAAVVVAALTPEIADRLMDRLKAARGERTAAGVCTDFRAFLRAAGRGDVATAMRWKGHGKRPDTVVTPPEPRLEDSQQ